MPPHDEEVREWLQKADEDLDAARRLLTPEPLTTPAAFHCQQAAEKALKAFLISKGQRFRRVHNLVYLIDLCEEHEPGFGTLRSEVQRLNPFAVDERYPGARESPSAEVARALLDIAERVVHVVHDALDF